MRFVAQRLLTAVLVVGLLCVAGCDDETTEDEESTAEVTEQESEDVDDADEDDEGDESPDDEGAADEDESDSDDGDEDEDDEESADGDDGDESEETDGSDGDEEGSETAEALDVDDLTPEDFEHLPVYATGPVAAVDGEEISSTEFNMVAEQQLAGIPAETIQMQGQQVEQMLVEGAISGFLLEREIENRDIQISDEAIDQAIEEFEQMMEHQAGDQLGEMQALMEQQGIDDAVLREQAEQQLAAEKLITDGREMTVSDDEVRQYYEQQQAQMPQGDEPQTRARHILLNVDDHDDGEGNDDEMRQKAEELAEQLQNGDAEIAELAREHSDGPSASEGGDLGYFTRDQLMPEFTEVAFELSPGEISDPVRSNLGWHVIQVEDRRDGGPSFEDVRDDLRMALEAQQLQQAAAELVQQLRNDADVEVYDDNIVFEGT